MNESSTFVGLDAHKKEHRLAVFLPGSDIPEEHVIANQRRDIDGCLRRLLRKVPGEIVVAYEAGVCGFALQRQIERPGVRCMVIAPSLMPVKAGDRIHTDRRDAASIGRNLRSGSLTEVHPPNPRQEAARDLCRCREAAMDDLRASRHRLLKFLLRRGYYFRDGQHWTLKHMAWLRSLRLEVPLEQEIFTEYLREVEHDEERLARLDKRLDELAGEEEYRQKVGWLRCYQGINTVTALSLITELYAFERFTSAPKFMAFLGLVPSEDSSGPTIRRGPITKAGNRRVRRLLIEAAWHQRRRATASKVLKRRREGQPEWAVAMAQRAQERLYRRYWRLSTKGKPANQVATAVARELAGWVWAMLQGGRAGPRTRRPLNAEAASAAAVRRRRPRGKNLRGADAAPSAPRTAQASH